MPAIQSVEKMKSASNRILLSGLLLILINIRALANDPYLSFNTIQGLQQLTYHRVIEGSTVSIPTEIRQHVSANNYTDWNAFSEQNILTISGTATYGVDYRIRAWQSPYDTSSTYVTNPIQYSNGTLGCKHTTFYIAAGHNNAIYIETIHNSNIVYNQNKTLTVNFTATNSYEISSSVTIEIKEIDRQSDPNSRINGISSKGLVGSGNNVMISGFITTGTTNKTLLMRGVGPSLSYSGTLDAISNPYIELYNSNSILVESNDDWQSGPNANQLVQLGQAPSNPLESAILDTFSPGLRTLMLKNSGTGSFGLLEVWDISNDTGSKITAISTRARVGSNDRALTAGFSIISGAKRVIITGKGPELANYGVSGTADGLALTLYDSSGHIIEYNAGWKQAWNADVIAANPQHPTMDNEAAIVETLPPGLYTAILSATTEGVGLVEVYEY